MKAELNPAYLGQIERGLKCPTIETLYKITCALDVSLPEFFGFDAKSGVSDSAKQIQGIVSTIPSNKVDRFTAAIAELARLIQD